MSVKSRKEKREAAEAKAANKRRRRRYHKHAKKSKFGNNMFTWTLLMLLAPILTIIAGITVQWLYEGSPAAIFIGNKGAEAGTIIFVIVGLGWATNPDHFKDYTDERGFYYEDRRQAE